MTLKTPFFITLLIIISTACSPATVEQMPMTVIPPTVLPTSPIPPPESEADASTATPLPTPTPLPPQFIANLSQGGNGDSYEVALSANGRWVVMTSRSDSWLPNDTHTCQVQAKTVSCADIFWLDRETQARKRLSTASDGSAANGDSFSPQISDDGQWVVFVSQADNLVADDTNKVSDVFLHHVPSGLTRRISVGSDGTESNGRSFGPKMSANGQWIMFASEGNNLVFGDTNRHSDIFLYDHATGQLKRVSLTETGQQSHQNSWPLAISANGQHIVFGAGGDLSDDLKRGGGVFIYQQATQQVKQVVKKEGSLAVFAASISAEGRFLAYQIFEGQWVIRVQDVTNDTSQVVSVSSAGVAANLDSFAPVISADGQKVVFSSRATNLVSENTHEVESIFWHDLTSGQTHLISRNEQDEAGNNLSELPTLTAEGRWVAFTSKADNLMAEDTNQHGDIFMVDTQLISPTTIATSTDNALQSMRFITSGLTLDYEVEDVKISPNHERLAVVGGGVTAIYELPTLSFSHYIDTGEAASATWDPESYRLATAKYNGAVPVWASETAGKLSLLGVLLKEDDLGKPWQPMTRWSHDGQFVVSNSIDEKIYIWQVMSGTMESVLNVDGAKGVTGLAWSPDDRQVLFSDSKGVRLWNISTGQSRLILPANPAQIFTNLAWSADGQAVAFGSYYTATTVSQVHLWRPQSGLTVLEGYPARISSVAWSPQNLLAVGGEAGLWLWDMAGGAPVATVSPPNILAVDWSMDGRYLVAGTAEGMVQMWQVD